MKKVLLTSAFSLFIFTIVSAQSSKLLDFPFGIELGVTQLQEIQDKVTKDNTDDGLTDEIGLSVLGGEFDIAVSLNGIVVKVAFDEKEDHTLPKSWRDLGIELAKCSDCDANSSSSLKVSKVKFNQERGACKIFGTSLMKFLEIIEKEGAREIKRRGVNEVSFVVDKFLFKAYFENPVCGLTRVSIAESF